MTPRYMSPSNGDTFVTWFQDRDFDESQTCPLWLDFMDFFTGGDREIITTLQQWIGSVLLPKVRHEKALWLYGDGDNGKSVWTEAVSQVIGTHLVASLSIEQLAGNHELAALVNKRLNVSMEFEKFTPKLISAIKRLSSNETVAINEKYKPVYFAKLNIRLLFGSNSVPYVSDHSDGFWRRCILVPCLAKVSPEKKDLDLVNRLVTTEAAGIFNWILEGAVDVMRAGGKIFVAEQVEALVARQRDIMDPHRLFVEQELTTALVDSFLPGVQGIYPRYTKWMEARGHKTPLSWERFCEVIKRVYPDAEHTQARDSVVGKCRGFRGICWRGDTEFFEEA